MSLCLSMHHMLAKIPNFLLEVAARWVKELCTMLV